MKNIIFLLSMAISGFGYSQKTTTEIIGASGINAIEIKADEVFKIAIKTADVDEISISTVSEGEYFQNINISSTLEEKELLLESHFQEKFQSGFDKLSAHKVFSIELQVLIPEGMELRVSSNIANVHVEGDYEKVQIQLKQGDLELWDFSGKAVVNTYDGDIFLKMKNVPAVEAFSRNGKVEMPKENEEGAAIKLHSISGDIKVIKTK